MTDYKFNVGDVVVSGSGRDKDLLLAVVKTDENYVYVCDGHERPLCNPKRKNPRHLIPTRHCVDQSAFRGNNALKKQLSQIAAGISGKENE